VRFNSPEHLATWRETGCFPAIHDAIAGVAVAYLRGTRLLDLGCSYGLLGARIVKEAGLEAGFGVDADGEVIAAAKRAGVPLTFRELRITGETLPHLLGVLVESLADIVIARRVLPELFGEDLPAGRTFANLLAGAGVKEIILEGRANVATAVNRLRSIEEEVDLLSGRYREQRRVGAVSYLVVR
jgi:SAM-dependent methyltransferase